MKSISAIVTVVIFISTGIVLAFTGYMKSCLDEELRTHLFTKKYPTLKMRFYDPFASESDDVPIIDMPLEDRREFADYCKFRFGIVDDSVASLENCKTVIPSYRR